MAEALKKVPAEDRWAIATRALTGGIAAIAKADRDEVGQERYNEISGQVWAELGKTSKLVADALGQVGGDAKSAAKSLQLVTDVAMGPEFKRTVEGTAEKAILRTTECVWWNRQKELEVSDLCSVACPAYCDAFAKSLNPKITVSLTKAMLRGDPYCEHVWKLQK